MHILVFLLILAVLIANVPKSLRARIIRFVLTAGVLFLLVALSVRLLPYGPLFLLLSAIAFFAYRAGRKSRHQRQRPAPSETPNPPVALLPAPVDSDPKAPPTPPTRRTAMSPTPQTLEALTRELEILHLEASKFALQSSLKIHEANSQTQNGMIIHSHAGDEQSDFSWGLLAEKLAVPINRRIALSTYNALERECRQLQERINRSEAVQQAETLLGEATRLDFRFSAPDSDTSLANERWVDNTLAAIERLTEFAEEVVEHLERITRKLQRIETQSAPSDAATPQ